MEELKLMRFTKIEKHTLIKESGEYPNLFKLMKSQNDYDFSEEKKRDDEERERAAEKAIKAAE